MPLKGELQLLEYPFALAMLTVDAAEPCDENFYPPLAAAYGSLATMAPYPMSLLPSSSP
jgi:hypothetical protein